jgi:hypothetical protein
MPCITNPTLSGTFHFSLPTTNMHDGSIYPSSTHYTALLTTHALANSSTLDAYALPLDGTPTYANISDAVRLLPSITACSIAVPHGLTANDR